MPTQGERGAVADVFATRCHDPTDIGWLLDAVGLPPRVGTACLKLNLCDYRDGSSGATTSLGFVSWLIDELRARLPGLDRILLLEHDSSSTRAMDLFDLLGFTELARAKGCELFDPSDASWVAIDSVGDLPVSLPDAALGSDLFVNVPKMKFHGKTAYTGALKNNFGLVRRKWKLPYHGRLCETIIRANLPLPRQLTVADGLITMHGRGPSYGVPARSNVAIACWDPVAADAAGARLLGLRPQLLRWLRLAEKAGLGSSRYTLHEREPRVMDERPTFDWARFIIAAATRRS